MEKFRLAVSTAEKNLAQGVFIVLLNATSAPPHLLLSIGGQLFSITDVGKQMGSPLEKMILFIQRKKIPALFIEWKIPQDWTIEKLETEARKNFSKYERVIAGKASCLFPIRDTATAIYGNEMQAANFIFELLSLMEKENAIGETIALNMENETANGFFELLTYNDEQLKESLQPTQASQTEKPQH